jgi:hypothetical protein
VSEDDEDFTVYETPSDFDEHGQPKPPRCPHGIDPVLIYLKGKSFWLSTEATLPDGDPICEVCFGEHEAVQQAVEDEMPENYAVTSVHVEVEPEKVEAGPPTSLVDTVDLPLSDEAWEEIRELVLNDPELTNLDDVLDTDRQRKLASLSPAALLQRIGKAERIPHEEVRMMYGELAVVAAHIVHLANLKGSDGKVRVPYATWRGFPRWMNPSCVAVGPTGSGKGNALAKVHRILGWILNGTEPQRKSAVCRTGYSGRATIQGLIGSVRTLEDTTEVVVKTAHGKETEKDTSTHVEVVPGLLEELQDGVAFGDEMTTLFPTQKADMQLLATLMELMWRGEAPITLVAGKRIVKSWTILLAAVQPDNWNTDLASSLGLFRRVWIHSVAPSTAKQSAEEVRSQPPTTLYDTLAYVVLRAKLKRLWKGLDAVETFDFSEINAWVAAEIELEVLPKGEDAVFVAVAVGDYVLNLPSYVGLAGNVKVSLTTSTQLLLEEGVAARREYRLPTEMSLEERVFESVVRRTKDGQVLAMSDLVSDLVSECGSYGKKVREIVDAMIEEAGEDGTLKESPARPLRAIPAAQAFDWTKSRDLPTPPPPGEKNRTPRVGHRGVLLELGFDTWVGATREKPWKKG